ncbi:MAG TPA: dodecin domain-containing protein [Bacteroidetes bacterium]|nr:dodecin domain-containing protein [Bacteroidota bacterium]
MANVYKKIEIVGTSTESFDDAVRVAIQKAAESVDAIGWFEVVEQRGRVENGKVAEFQVTVKVGFKVLD